MQSDDFLALIFLGYQQQWAAPLSLLRISLQFSFYLTGCSFLVFFAWNWLLNFRVATGPVLGRFPGFSYWFCDLKHHPPVDVFLEEKEAQMCSVCWFSWCSSPTRDSSQAATCHHCLERWEETWAQSALRSLDKLASGRLVYLCSLELSLAHETYILNVFHLNVNHLKFTSSKGSSLVSLTSAVTPIQPLGNVSNIRVNSRLQLLRGQSWPLSSFLTLSLIHQPILTALPSR